MAILPASAERSESLQTPSSTIACPRRILEVHRARIEQGIGRERHVFAPLHGISQMHHHWRYVDTVTDDFDVEVGHIEDRLYGTRHLVDTDLVRDLHRIVEVRPRGYSRVPKQP